jgi:hypothetical protein
VTNESELDIADKIHKFYEEIAIPAESFAQTVAFAMSQLSFVFVCAEPRSVSYS